MKCVTSSAVFGLTLYTAAEVLLFISYRNHDARFHWFTHFFVGAIVALLIMSVIAWLTKRPIRLPLLWPLLAHLFAMFPDFLFSFKFIAHERWMDLFLFHISSHFVPGRNITWYVLFISTVGLYLWIYSRTLKDV